MFNSKTSSRSSGGTICFFCCAGGSGGFGGSFGLFVELYPLQGEEVLGAEDGVFEGAVGVVEEGGLGEGGLLLGERLGGEAVGVEFAAQGVEVFFEGGGVEVELLREREEGEVVCCGCRHVVPLPPPQKCAKSNKYWT